MDMMDIFDKKQESQSSQCSDYIYIEKILDQIYQPSIWIELNWNNHLSLKISMMK